MVTYNSVLKIISDDLSSDLFIPQQQLNALSKEAAKLKNSGAMSSMPGQKVLRLLDVLSHNIKGGLNVLPLADPVSITHIS